MKAELADINWRTSGRLKVKRRTQLQLEDIQGEGVDMDGLTDARLLPGAKELVCVNRGRLELWTLENPECLWAAPPYNGKHDCLNFDLELTDSGNLLNIAGLFASEDQFHP